MSYIIDWLEQNLQACPIKERFGFDCLGCGAQTALIQLLKGNFVDSFIIYPGLVPIILLFVLFFMQIVFKSRIIYKVLKIWFIFTVFIIVIGYIIKLINL